MNPVKNIRDNITIVAPTISPITNKTLPASFTKATPNHALRQTIEI